MQITYQNPPNYEMQTVLESQQLLKLSFEHLLYALWVKDSLRIRKGRGKKVLDSSIDDKSLAGDQACSIAEQEDGGVGNILNDPFTTKRNEVFDWSLIVGNTKAGHSFGFGDGSRSDDVRTNPPRALLNCNYTREGINPSFGRGHVGLVWKSYQES